MKIRKANPLVYAMLSVGIISGSCTKLEVGVYDQVLETSFRPTEADIPNIIGPVYTNMRGMMASWQGMFDLQEEPADIIVTPVRPNGWYDAGTYQRMHKHDWTPTQWQPQNAWNHCFTGINNVNRILAQFEDGSIPITTGKEALVAELKTARAFYYSVLVDNHGNVPLVTDFKSSELPSQATRQQVYEFVEKELLENMDQLITTNNTASYGRFTKWAAKAILARLYLNAEVYTGTPQWAKVIEQCDDILAGPFVLEATYKANFSTNNQNSKELIFAVPYDEVMATQWNMHMKTLATAHRNVLAMAAQPWGGNCAVPQFIDTYDPEDTRLKDTWIQGPQYSATNGSLVLTYSKHVPSIDNSDFFDGYRIGKYEIKIGATGALSNDYPVFRLADVMMMKAEALLRSGQPDAAATIVTEVRQRAFASTNPAKATVTGAQLQGGSSYNYGFYNTNGTVTETQGGADIPFGRMLDELGWEFAAEGRRRMDLIRFGVFDTKIWFNHRPKNDGKKRTLFPIPQLELDKNPNLQQNADYK
jgi:starch-binding outer membrane protein, SusD/RagB family